MKRILSLILSCLLVLTVLSGCGDSSVDGEKLSVVCTVFPQYDFVRNIAVDKADIKMLVPLGTESHDFQLESLTVSELKTVATADLEKYRKVQCNMVGYVGYGRNLGGNIIRQYGAYPRPRAWTRRARS